MRYIKCTSTTRLVFEDMIKAPEMVEYVDYDYVEGLNKRRSLIGYLLMLGGGLISWKANL